MGRHFAWTGWPAKAALWYPSGVKVAIFSDHTGGVYVYSQRLTKQLVELGAQVEFITHPPNGRLGTERLASLQHDGVTVRPVPRHAKEVSKEQMLQLYQAYLDANADIIIPNYRTISYAACAKLPRKKASRVIGICHDHTPTMYKYLSYYEPIIDGFVCPASVSYEHLRKVLPHRREDIRLIRHGIPDAGDAPANFDGGEIRLIYHGRLEEEQKSVSSLIGLAEILARKGVDFRLILVGDGPNQQTYRDRVDESGLSERVTFLGHLEGADLENTLREAHVAVLTSRHEGFCLSLAEAMGVGLPAIAFDCGGGINDYLVHGETGFILPWGDLDGMSERVEHVAGNPAEWQRLSRNARQRMAEGFSIKEFGEKSRQFMAELLERSGDRGWPRLEKSLFFSDSRLASLRRRIFARDRAAKIEEPN